MGKPLESGKAHALVPRLGEMENLICEVEAESRKESRIRERICEVEAENGRCKAQGLRKSILLNLHGRGEQRI